MARLGLVIFSIEPSHWDSLDHGEPLADMERFTFSLFDGAHGMRGNALRLLERPQVEGEVKEEWWVN